MDRTRKRDGTEGPIEMVQGRSDKRTSVELQSHVTGSVGELRRGSRVGGGGTRRGREKGDETKKERDMVNDS